jgi:hypothetical protein
MRNSFALALLLLATASGTAWAQSAGRFIVVVGDVQVLGRDGAARPAVRDTELEQGESIVTGANSLAQLRMNDGGAISVRPETQLKLDTFKYTEGGGADDSFLVSVLKGGLRTLTGLIARSRPNNFLIATPAVTIGVRGTDFEVVHVLQQATPDAPPGTYNRVYDGITTVQNQAGPLALVSRNETAFVPLGGNVRPVLVTPPVSLFGKPTPTLEIDPRLRRPGTAPGPRTDNKGAHKGRPLKVAPLKVAPLKIAPDRVISPAPAARESTPLLLNPIDTPRILAPAPTTTEPLRTISPTLTPSSPTLTPISPTLTPISPTPTVTEPVRTISPTLTPISPTPTISPTLTPISPTPTISPTLTPISPTPTISPTLTAPTTTISPTPSTTTISPSTTTIIKR